MNQKIKKEHKKFIKDLKNAINKQTNNFLKKNNITISLSYISNKSPHVAFDLKDEMKINFLLNGYKFYSCYFSPKENNEINRQYFRRGMTNCYDSRYKNGSVTLFKHYDYLRFHNLSLGRQNFKQLDNDMIEIFSNKNLAENIIKLSKTYQESLENTVIPLIFGASFFRGNSLSDALEIL